MSSFKFALWRSTFMHSMTGLCLAYSLPEGLYKCIYLQANAVYYHMNSVISCCLLKPLGEVHHSGLGHSSGMVM